MFIGKSAPFQADNGGVSFFGGKHPVSPTYWILICEYVMFSPLVSLRILDGHKISTFQAYHLFETENFGHLRIAVDDRFVFDLTRAICVPVGEKTKTNENVNRS